MPKLGHITDRTIYPGNPARPCPTSSERAESQDPVAGRVKKHRATTSRSRGWLPFYHEQPNWTIGFIHLPTRTTAAATRCVLLDITMRNSLFDIVDSIKMIKLVLKQLTNGDYTQSSENGIRILQNTRECATVTTP